MASFPNLKSGHPLRYPSSRVQTYRSRVIQFGDWSEKRWPATPVRDGWTLGLQNISGYELSLIRQFWRSMQGAKDKTWDITIDAVLIENCTFLDDEFPLVEIANSLGVVSLSLRFRQVK